MAQFEVSTNPPMVAVDGVDITHDVTHMVIELDGVDQPLVILTLVPKAIRVSAEGLVIENPTTQMLTDFLDGMDAGAIEKAALDDLEGFGDDRTMVEIILAKLKEAINGAES